MPILLEMRFPVTLGAPSAARRSLEDLSSRLDAGTLERIRLLVSELITNSIRYAGLDGAHGEGWISLKVEENPGVIRVEVTDSGPGFRPTDFPVVKDRVSGWGLYLVDRLADRWGVDTEQASQVWFEIDNPPATRES